MANPVTYTFSGADTDYVCVAQTRSSAGSLTLNGAGADAMSALKNNPRVWLTGSGFERTVSITSAGTVSGLTFTVTGKNIRGESVTAAITGPAATTVESTYYFYLISDVSVNGTLSTSTSVGIGTTGRSQWYKVDYQLTPVTIGLGITTSGTDATWTVVQTTYNVEDGEPPANAIINHPDSTLVAQTVSRQGNYSVPFGATRCQISASTGGSVVFDLYQAGIV